MNKTFIKLIVVALALFGVAAIAQTVTADVGANYSSALVEKGVRIGNATLAGNANLRVDSFGLGVVAYAPTSVSLGNSVKTELNRVDVVGSYTFKSTLADVTISETYKHYNTLTKSLAQGQLETALRLSDKWKSLPVYAQVAYDNKTRAVNTEAGIGARLPLVRGLNVEPAVYAGYNDYADTFPRSLKEVRSNNRYIGGSLALSTEFTYGKVSVGVATNRADNKFGNTTNYWFASVSSRF